MLVSIGLKVSEMLLFGVKGSKTIAPSQIDSFFYVLLSKFMTLVQKVLIASGAKSL